MKRPGVMSVREVILKLTKNTQRIDDDLEIVIHQCNDAGESVKVKHLNYLRIDPRGRIILTQEDMDKEPWRDAKLF